jgi:heptosyltransferase-2
MFTKKEEVLDEKYYPSLKSDPEKIKILSSKYKIDLEKKIIIFAPGAAFGPSKMWPVEKFKELGEKLNKDFFILILGSKSEKSIGDKIVTNKNIINLCGETSITDAIDLMHISEFCVSNDSGLMHLAAATNTKSISIYGATSPELTPPLTSNKQIHYRGLPCSPCFEKICKYGHYNCLVEIQANDVFKSFK